MPGAFYDTNLFLYAAMRALPDTDAPKKPVARAMIERADFGLSAQVLAEFYANVRKKGDEPLSHDEASEWVDLMLGQPCVTVDSDLVRAGSAVAHRYEISYWDGAIIAAAHLIGATKLYTEDLNDGQQYGDITVVNPFKNSPDLIGAP